MLSYRDWKQQIRWIMANIHKQSVQQELDRLKSDFSRLSNDRELPPEITVLINSMFMLMELICAIFLEKKTKKTKDNSSIPPSQSEKDETSLSDKGSKSKGKTENDKLADNCRTTETVTISSVDTCGVCGEDMTDVPCCEFERRTKIDIVFEKVIEHVDAEVKVCDACQSTTKGLFPSDMPGPLQYGAGIKAFAVNLLICQMVALGRVQKTIKAMIGQAISEATLLKYVLQLHRALASWEDNAIDALQKSAVMHVDETSLRVDKKKYWIHVYSSGDITLKRLHRRRGKEAIEHIDIVPKYGGVIIHDCWASYLSYDHCGHGLCGAHLLRELTYIVQSNDYRWAANLKALLKEACKTVARSKRKKLTEQEYKTLQRRYRNILTRGASELPAVPPKPSGQRGKMAKSDAHNLWERLHNYEEAVLLFAKEPYVAFTNNRAERDLRMAKVKQKVSGCFRNVEYAHAYCRISSYIQTMGNKGYNPLIAIQMALAGKFDE